MNILYIGDIMGERGIETVRRVLPELRQAESIDLVIAQAENVTDGKSMSPADMKLLQGLGVDFFTGGNHTPKRRELAPLLEDGSAPVIAPANLTGAAGKGWKYVSTSSGPVLIISLLGSTVGRSIESSNPLHAIDQILADNTGTPRVATVVNFHGDYSSEKQVIGYYLDGRVTAVIGDHWHIPTADAKVLPKGTAHITDVGMCGVLYSSLGVKVEAIVARWRDEIVNVNELETEGPLQFNAVLIESDNQTGLAKSIMSINKIIDL
jgi:metallophosphoesterase (TIGR00282 family)